MKRIRQLSAAAVLCLISAMPAMADEGVYAGISVVQFTQKADIPGISDSGNSTGFMLQVGSNFNEYLAMEIRIGTTATATLPRIAATLDTTLSSFLIRGKLPINDNFRLYGLFGTTSGNLNASGGLVGSTSRMSLSYGAGLQAHSGPWSGSVEWVRYWDKVNCGTNITINIDGIGATLGYDF